MKKISRLFKNTDSPGEESFQTIARQTHLFRKFIKSCKKSGIDCEPLAKHMLTISAQAWAIKGLVSLLMENMTQKSQVFKQNADVLAVLLDETDLMESILLDSLETFPLEPIH